MAREQQERWMVTKGTPPQHCNLHWGGIALRNQEQIPLSFYRQPAYKRDNTTSLLSSTGAPGTLSRSEELESNTDDVPTWHKSPD